MSYQNGPPKIVTDGLVLMLDPIISKSYPGSGNTIYDLSGKGNNGTLVGPPTYWSDGRGCFYYNGNSYILVPHNAISMDFSLAQTICMWIKPGDGSESARRNPYNQAYGGPGTITYETNKTLNYYFGPNGGDTSPFVNKNSVFTVNNNELAYISVTRDQPTNTVKWYKNGAFVTSDHAQYYTSLSNGTSNILIGDGYVSGFLGTIYIPKVYNRALTANEIAQNYNVTKYRFGL
jgi:hypothetical protein